MTPTTRFKLLALAALVSLPFASTGCNWLDSMKGEGFPQWSDSIENSARAKNPDAKPSGFFTDRRSEQIEKSLGGGF